MVPGTHYSKYMKSGTPKFSGGNNVAIKIPKHKYAETVHFYKEIVKLPYKGKEGKSHSFQFGQLTLWLDEVDSYSQTDVWLEMFTDDTEKAITYLEGAGISRRDEIEPLEGIDGHWVSDPAGVIHLLMKEPINEKD